MTFSDYLDPTVPSRTRWFRSILVLSTAGLLTMIVNNFFKKKNHVSIFFNYLMKCPSRSCSSCFVYTIPKCAVTYCLLVLFGVFGRNLIMILHSHFPEVRYHRARLLSNSLWNYPSERSCSTAIERARRWSESKLTTTKVISTNTSCGVCLIFSSIIEQFVLYPQSLINRDCFKNTKNVIKSSQ